ncbi:hypothetical protein F2Q69_00048746 [Brassica cretica]|uniref:Uncharacterized protein n=1 Tax=Brassica cretica TaxID=69181 RepID=A0A8S9PRC7_BRACR|nr:hypothetical protein F2Q69_00048746 [Brassica cretica]
MQVDEATEGRRLRKRKEKIPKNLKREANEKKIDCFTKRVLRIPVEKPFDEVYFTHRLWMFFRETKETKETEEDIRRMFHHVNLVELGNDLGYIASCHCGAEYEIEYSESIDTHTTSSIDSNESPTTDEHYPRRSTGSIRLTTSHSGFHESFAVETVIPSSNEDPTEEYDEDYLKERAIEIAMQDDRYSINSFNNTSPPSIDANKATSIDVKPQTSHIPAEPECLTKKKDEWDIAYINTGINDVYNPLKNNVDWLSTRIDLLQQDLDTIRKKDPQPATSIDICTITSIDSKFASMEDRLQTYEDMHDRFTSPIMRYLDTLFTQMMNVQKDIGKLNDQHDFQNEGSTSIDRFPRASLDGKKPTEHLPCTTAEVAQITSKLYTALDTMEERLEKRCDDIYFPFDVRLCRLDSQAEWLQKEVKAIRRQLASQHHISASITRKHSKLIDSKAPASTDKHLVASIDTTSTPDDEQLIQNKMESMHEELNELSAYAYDKIG